MGEMSVAKVRGVNYTKSTTSVDESWRYNVPPAEGSPVGSIVIDDLNSDGQNEVIFATYNGFVEVRNGADGTAYTGWPLDLDEPLSTTPAVANVAGAASKEIIVPTNNGNLKVIYHTGDIALEIALRASSACKTPVIYDTDGDGTPEIMTIVGRYFQIFSVQSDSLVEDGYIEFSRNISSDIAIGERTAPELSDILIAVYDTLYSLSFNGSVFDTNWAFGFDREVTSAPAVSNIDRDASGTYETAIVGYEDDSTAYLTVINQDGSLFWQADVGSNNGQSPVVGDIDNDNEMEATVCNNSQIFSFNYDGTALTGFPYDSLSGLTTPILGHLDRSGSQSIGLRAGDRSFHAISSAGSLIALLDTASAPVDSFIGSGNSSPTLGDMAGDGDVEVVSWGRESAPTWTYFVRSMDLGAPACSTNFAPMWGVNPRHTRFWNSNITSIEEHRPLAGLPADIKVGAFPNPFNGRVEVEVETKRSIAGASVNVLNIKGDKVGQLYSGRLETGRHVFTWQPAENQDLPSGIYFIALSAPDGRTVSTKVIYAK